MANNFVIKDANSNSVTFQSTDVGGGTQLSNVKQNDGVNDIKSASAANLSGFSGINAQQVAPPGMWSVTHAPAVNTAASASKAAGAAGVRHVCTAVSFTFAAGTAAPTAVQLTVNLRDGATGAGTILMTWTVCIPATAGQTGSVSLSGLNLVGSAATAMTLEFTAAGGANTFESCNIAGYDVS